MAVFAALAKKVYDQGFLPLPGYNVTRRDAEEALKTIAPLAITAIAPQGFKTTVNAVKEVLSSPLGASLKKIFRHEANVSSFNRRQAYLQHAVHYANRRNSGRQRFLRRFQKQQHRLRFVRPKYTRGRKLFVYSNRNKRMRSGRQWIKHVRPFVKPSWR